MPGRLPEHRCCAATGRTAGKLASCLLLAGAIGLPADPWTGPVPPAIPGNADLMNELALSGRASELDPENRLIANTCGWVYFRLNRITNALPYLQEAALLTNNDPVVLQHLGDTYLKRDRRRDEIATWRRALEQDPGNRDLAARIDAALAQANDAHLRSAPTK